MELEKNHYGDNKYTNNPNIKYFLIKSNTKRIMGEL